MIIQIDLQSETPIYEQLMNQIIEGIAAGELKPGDPLPSVRSLASDVGINLHTVNKAYTLLKQEGFIQIHRQKGVVVQPDTMPGMTSAYTEKLQSELKPIIAEAKCRGMTMQDLTEAVAAMYRGLGRV
ncbi:GntR family transcriptional regulator [Paenibacillus contaminans]|uniref:GntR family transcriptional regulator n=1 Tax=Paenibacillus contaminans TaxID=450362 RepID=A0A329MCH9_9BACL|nr:GntR family transcriptional regulator [Paenibacillus contaminans]RAV17322.1 GntR family transcriptional regulator [Paenibacillus contaminans]